MGIVGVGIAAGASAFGLTTAAGTAIGGMAATGIGLIAAVPIAGLIAGIKAMWTREG